MKSHVLCILFGGKMIRDEIAVTVLEEDHGMCFKRRHVDRVFSFVEPVFSYYERPTDSGVSKLRHGPPLRCFRTSGGNDVKLRTRLEEIKEAAVTVPK